MTEDDLNAVVVRCPKCGWEQLDTSGRGFHYCEKCTFCMHVVYWKRRCLMCGQEEPLMKLKTFEFDEAERAVLMACREAHIIGYCMVFDTLAYQALVPAADRVMAYGLIRWTNGGPDSPDGYHLTEMGEYHADRLLSLLPKGMRALDVAEDVARRLARRRPDDAPPFNWKPLWVVWLAAFLVALALLLSRL